MKKLIFTLLILTVTSPLFSQTPARMMDGYLQFVAWNADGNFFFTDAEKDAYVNSITSFTPVVSAVVPEPYEVNLSTCIKFLDGRRAYSNLSDWLSCNTRAGLREKVKLLKQEYDQLADIDDVDKVDAISRYRWLKSYYKGLPAQ